MKLSNLLNKTPESFYWLGFLLADGHFSTENRLTVVLSAKDNDHLIKLSKFLNIENPKIYNRNDYETSEIRVMDNGVLKILKELYSISNRKTYIPPDLSTLTTEELFCVSIGFIDGDGSLSYQTGRNDYKLSIKCHQSWLSTLDLLYNKSKIVNSGYSVTYITDNEIIREMKRKATRLNLPIMNRKWDKVDTLISSRVYLAKMWHKEAIRMYSEGNTIKHIANTLGKKYITVYNAINRNKKGG